MFDIFCHTNFFKESNGTKQNLNRSAINFKTPAPLNSNSQSCSPGPSNKNYLFQSSHHGATASPASLKYQDTGSIPGLAAGAA